MTNKRFDDFDCRFPKENKGKNEIKEKIPYEIKEHVR